MVKKITVKNIFVILLMNSTSLTVKINTRCTWNTFILSQLKNHSDSYLELNAFHRLHIAHRLSHDL